VYGDGIYIKTRKRLLAWWYGVVVHVDYMRRGIAPDGDWWLKVRPVPGDERLLQSLYGYIV
jgi:hypothetical protein